MDDSTLIITVAAGVAALLIAVAAILHGWSSWLQLKRAEIDIRGAAPITPSPAARIELADLKERVRRLEAIADGVDS